MKNYYHVVHAHGGLAQKPCSLGVFLNKTNALEAMKLTLYAKLSTLGDAENKLNISSKDMAADITRNGLILYRVHVDTLQQGDLDQLRTIKHF